MTPIRWLKLSAVLALAMGCGGVNAKVDDAGPADAGIPDARDPATIPHDQAMVTSGGGAMGGPTDLPSTSKTVVSVGQIATGDSSGGGFSIQFGLLHSVKVE